MRGELARLIHSQDIGLDLETANLLNFSWFLQQINTLE
jgi:hypothetical protein